MFGFAHGSLCVKHWQQLPGKEDVHILPFLYFLKRDTYLCLCVCDLFVCLFYNHVMCLMGPEEGVGSPGAGVIASGKQPDVGAGVGT